MTMPTIDELRKLMLEVGVEAATVSAIDPATALARYDFDSLDWPVFIIAVENRYGIKISDSDALKLKTLDDFIQFIKENT